MFTRSVIQSGAALLWNHTYQHNGLSICSHWQTLQLNCRKARVKSILCRTGLNGHICNGWKIFVTGVYQDSSGGVTASRPGIIEKQVNCMSARKHRPILKTGNRMRMYLIHGSHLHYGLSRQWAGLMKDLKISSDTSLQMYL